MAKQGGAGASTKSSTKSFKSLASKASETIKNIKRKAVNILSPKKKQAKHVVPESNSDISIDSGDPGSRTPSKKSSHHSNGSVREIPDEEEPDNKLIE